MRLMSEAIPGMAFFFPLFFSLFFFLFLIINCFPPWVLFILPLCFISRFPSLFAETPPVDQSDSCYCDRVTQ